MIPFVTYHSISFVTFVNNNNMGKKRIITQTGTDSEILKQQVYISKKKVDAGIFLRSGRAHV